MRKIAVRSLEITKASLRAVRSSPSLAVFPLLSALAFLLLAASFLWPVARAWRAEAPDAAAAGAAAKAKSFARWVDAALFVRAPGEGIEGEPEGLTRRGWIALGCGGAFYLACFFLATFFGAAQIHAALQALKGEPARIGESLGFACSRLRAILSYSLLAASVGLLLQWVGSLLEERLRWLGRLLGGLAGIAWTLAVYLVVPVMVQERRGGLDAVRRSMQLFRRTWGDAALAHAGFGLLWIPILVAGLAGLAVPLWLKASGWLSPEGTLLAMGGWLLAYAAAAATLHQTLESVYRAALYVFAAEGVVPAPFRTEALEEIWRVKGDGDGRA